MNKKYLITAVAFSWVLGTTLAHAVEIKIIDKTYDESQIRSGRTLQSDLDKGVPYQAVTPELVPQQKTKTPAVQPVKPAPKVDPVYTAPINEPEKPNTLQEDLDQGKTATPPSNDNDTLTIDTDKAVPQEQKELPKTMDTKPVPPAKQPVKPIPPVEQVTPPTTDEPVTEMPDETMAPSEREPILLGNMSDESLKKELGISGEKAESPAEATLEPEAGVEKSFKDDASIITAPPAQALPENTLPKTVQ